jgi:hypothetical protein
VHSARHYCRVALPVPINRGYFSLPKQKRNPVTSSATNGDATSTKRAKEKGREAATDILAFRKKQRKRRAAAIKSNEKQKSKAKDKALEVPREVVRALGPKATNGTLIAEGDSWFDYPMNDVLQLLEDHHGFNVESVSHHGDTVEEMAYSGGQLEEFARRLEKILRNGEVPRAILLSGGGNDIAGDEFPLLLNHSKSPNLGLNSEIISGVIDQRLRDAYTHIISAITAIAESYLGRPIPILVHGYDYAIPDGRGVLGGWWKLPGPWLEPGFRSKGYANRQANIATIKQLMDRFNDMLRALISDPAFAHVRQVDLRGTLSQGPNYKSDWGNELHPSKVGFEKVAKKFADAIDAIS